MANFTSAAQLTVADTAAALVANTPSLVSLGSAVTVTDSATVSVAAMASLAQIQAASAGFSLGANSLTVNDTASNLTGMTHAEVALTGSVVLSSNAVVNASQFGFLSSLPNMSLGGHLLTVSDTATGLLGLTGHFSLISAANLSADAVVSAASLNALTALPQFNDAGHTLTVTDTASNLLSLAGNAFGQVNATVLSSDALVSASQAQLLAADPAFSTGGHQLIIADTAANLLTLPHSLLVASTELVLSGDQTVSAAGLTQLAALGLKFSEAGHTLTCIDTAANLAALSPSAVALAGNEVLSSSATVTAATAAALASLPSLTAQSGVVLSVQDSVANLLALGQGAPAFVSSESLVPGSIVTITAGQATALLNLPHFSPTGATITVTDTVAALNTAGTSVLQAIAGSIDVVDSAAVLAGYSGSSLLQNASAVTLIGNAQVTAATAAQLATIPHFSAGPYQLTVADTAVNTASHAGAIVTLGANALVTDSGPVTTAVADHLAIISTAGTLSFQGGNQLLVQDSYAALTAPSNASGLALAARIGVLDSASNLVAASGHNWGALNPTYTLSQGGGVTASTVNSLASLGSHFSAGGFTLNVVDNAANVVGAASALNALHLTATVTDTAANVDAQASNLAGMGSVLGLLTFTDTGPVTAAVAAGVVGLSAVIGGPVLAVSDTAANVDVNFSQLQTLGSHISVAVHDSASNVGAHVSDLAALGSVITLTDVVPVTAAVAVALVPVTSQLAPGCQLSVNDTGAAIAANATALAGLSTHLGSVTLTDGNTLSAANAAALATIDSHFATGTMFTATGTAAAVAAAQTGLASLQADGRLAAVDVFGAFVADVSAHITSVNALSALVSINDTAANVDAGLSTLSQLGHLQSISLNDGGIPTLSMTIATMVADATVISKINTPFTITVSDTAAHLSADLALGASSAILGQGARIGQLTAADGGPVTLTQDQVLVTGINDGSNSVLSRFSGVLDVADVDISHLAQVANGTHSPAGIYVVDSAAAISADLAMGNASVLLSTNNSITHLTALGSVLTLTQQQALVTGVDDSSQSILSKTSGAQLTVTGATVAGLQQLGTLYQSPASISVNDTAANLSADLATGSSQLVANLPLITAVSVSDSQPITLTEAQLLAAHVDDGFGSLLSKTVGAQVSVTQVAAADLSVVLGLPVAPTQVSISDSAGHVVSNLSTIIGDINAVSAINITGGTTLTLTAAEALAANVDDGTGSLVDRVAGHVFDVTGASVAQLVSLTALANTPASVDVNDTSSNLVSDLTSGHSVLAASLSNVGAINVTHGQLVLTDAQADTILSTPSLDDAFSKLAPTTHVSISGVPVSDISALVGSGWPNTSIGVADTVANITADLSAPSSILLANSNACSSVVLTTDGTVHAEMLEGMAALPGFSTNGFSLVVLDTAAHVVALDPATLALAHYVQVSDTDLNVSNNLDSLQTVLGGALTITLTNSSPSITVTASTYAADHATIDAVTNSAAFTVTGTATDISALASILAADNTVGRVNVSDTAAHVIADLAALQQASGKLFVTLNDTSITANLVAPLLSIGNLSPSGLPVVDTGSQIASVIESGDPNALHFLNTYGATLSGVSAVTAADAAALETLTTFNKAGNALEVWDTAQHLASTNYSSALVNSLVDGVYLKTSGNAVTVSASQAAALFAIPHFTTSNPDGTVNSFTVSDTAAHIEANVAVLSAHLPSITSVVVAGSATINDHTLSDLQSLGAVAGTGTALVVQDTAATIANNAVAQSAAPASIIPTSWTLSSNGTVTESQVATLGSISNFNAGPYRISLGLVADAPISVSDANRLGNIAGALDLGGHHLIVSGSVAQLSALSSTALLLATPALVDSVADICALPSTSPLLRGTVEITGTDALTAGSASTLFGLIQSGSNPGIAPNALTFDHVHVVTDSIAGLQQLTSSSGWTNNIPLQTSIHTVAADSVANLTNPSNLSYLSSLSGSTLAGDVTIAAASAASLAANATNIHFSRGTHHITVADSAGALLNTSNAPGLALADSIQLSAPAQVDAADAETLLGLSHFSLTTALTVADSSTNLLDGRLEQTITASGFANDIHVQLAGPETLDADTAQSLVSISGFADSHNLTIADDPSYLLNSANLSAEQMAVQVTLPGDETVSANTILRLSGVPHFTVGSSHLDLASNDFADGSTLKAIADIGTAFRPGSHTVTMTSDALNLAPNEYNALQADNIVKNGHGLGILPTAVSLTDGDGILAVSGHGLSGQIIKIYGADGTLLSANSTISESFTVTASDTSPGSNFAVTSTAPGGGSEGAPVVVLDSAAVEAAATAAGATLATTGQIQVDSGKFIDVYMAGAVPTLTHPALVYNQAAHTVALDIPGHAPITLVTLGGTTHPGALTASEFFFKSHS